MRILCSKRGDGYLGTIIAILAILPLIAIVLETFAFLSAYTDLTTIARGTAEAAAVSGGATETAEERYRALCAETGRSPEVTYSADWFSEKDRTVQYGHPISVTVVSSDGPFGLTISVTSSSLSRVYWKRENGG
ncbi:MAG: DUF4320 family protein [Clostridia bacterium]|nr:DUF4320 family protein [Clostridia bacterium]